MRAAEPIKIGTKLVKNRITMAPTVKFFADEDGLVTQDYVNHYEERAAHECGFICVEATCIAKEARLFPGQLGLWNDDQIEGHKKIAEACHKYGAIVVPQIHYGGLGTHPACGPLTSPTKVMWNNGKTEVEAIELFHDDIKKIEEQFIAAAVRAQKAGYDGVQLHGCHSYLINDFASAVNKRTDEYGGNTENLARFGCEIISGIRKACGKDFIISTRVSGCEPTVKEALEIAEYYVQAGCDYLQVSCGIYGLEEVEHDESLPYNRIASLGVIFHEHFKNRVPVSCVNGIKTPELANYLLDNDLVDTIDSACGLLADPAFTEAILYGKPYVKCYNCKNGCGFGPMHSHICPAMVKRGANEFPGMWKN